MNTVKKVIIWAEVEMAKLTKEWPAVVKTYGNEGLHICGVVKTALASPTAAGIEAALAQMIPGGWVPEVVVAVTKALAVAIPGITGVVAHADLPLPAQGSALVQYLQGQSPKMQHAGFFKLLSGIFQALEPKMTEVAADTSAQLVYQHSVA
jgi:hypothetical protein